MARVRGLPDMARGRTVSVRAARCTWKKGAGRCRLLWGRGPCKESPAPSQGTAGAVDSFHVAIPREREVLSAQQQKTLTAIDMTNSGSHLNREPNIVRSRYKRQLIQLNVCTKVAYMG